MPFWGFICDFLLKSSNWDQINPSLPCLDSEQFKYQEVQHKKMTHIHLRWLIRCAPLSWPNNVSRRLWHSCHSGHHHWQRGPSERGSYPASRRTVSVNLRPSEPFFPPPRSSYYDFLLMHRGGLCDCLAIMGLCLINHVDPLCFTSKAAALRLINGDQGPLKRRLVTDSVHLDTQGPPCRQRRGPANT